MVTAATWWPLQSARRVWGSDVVKVGYHYNPEKKKISFLKKTHEEKEQREPEEVKEFDETSQKVSSLV